jgi:hypothetical protein
MVADSGIAVALRLPLHTHRRLKGKQMATVRTASPGEVTDHTYAITVRGVAGPSVRQAFDDVQMSVVGDTTVLRRAGADRAALRGLLNRINELGLEVIDLHRESAEPA